MWPFIEPINLIRYLCVWRVNRALVRLPAYLPLELSRVLGTIISESLPTRQARPWRKALAAQTPGGGVWPIEAVLFAYPGKQLYGPGEPIFWELKLLGPQADHAFFLEVILPAMEAAGQTTDSRWYQSNTLWGRFDIHSIYVAQGQHWQPVVSEGRLDTRYYPTPLQWADGLSFEPTPGDERTHRTLTWLTPVNLSPPPKITGSLALTPDEQGSGQTRSASGKKAKNIPVPTLQLLLEALLYRITELVPGKYTTPGDVWNMLSPDDQAALWDAVLEADQIGLHQAERQKIPKGWPAGWFGTQTFTAMPLSLLPYLELASILHLGRQTHLGCGIFSM